MSNVNDHFDELPGDCGVRVAHGCSWENTRCKSVPKEEDDEDPRLERSRWIANLNLHSQWRNKSWVGMFRVTGVELVVRTYGFRQGHCTEDVISWLVICLQRANPCVYMPIAAAVLDMFTAFDETKHEEIYKAAVLRGKDMQVLIGVLWDYYDETACIAVEGGWRDGTFRALTGELARCGQGSRWVQ